MLDLDSSTYDDFYNAPILDRPELGRLSRPITPVILRTPIPGGPNLYSYLGPGKSDTLFVTFHGAVNRDNDRYPRYDRVGSSAKRNRTLLAFADPTLTLTKDIGLGWYLGGRTWDPIKSIVETIQLARATTSSRKLILLGGSGGGFAAMRVGALLRDSLIFAFSPQSAVVDYNARIVSAYFAAAFPGEQQDDVVSAERDRFSVRSLFAERGADGPHLYYLQNKNDKGHMVKHYAPMKAALDVTTTTGTTADGLVRFMTYESDTAGHKPPSNEVFELHLEKARRFQAG